ncbi:MAG: isoprenoid biosynthesis glyoxalase ElbB [Thermaurantimonas sp.]|uniref:isoprenoid biosynthesis glyoxalase ElbB n=1 Tax=Thermaurantimonas sp. TaxID=2681568 RepID=UPI003918ECE3
MKKYAVLLAGCGVYDGSEIHEATFALLSIAQNGADYQCFAPNKNQHHVINHLTGQEMPETRNVLVESARIARGNIKDLKELDATQFDGLVMPGGFGAAKNWSKWAFEGPQGEIDPDVKKTLLDFVALGKPICALCIAPAVVAKALEGSPFTAEITLGSTAEPSPYDIAGTHQAVATLGVKPVEKTLREVHLDPKARIITAPCYMMEGRISDIYANIKMAIDQLVAL